jgi:hypothetical protein
MVESFKNIINGNGQIKTNRVSSFEKQWKLIKKYRFLFLISCLFCLGIVFLINRYTKPIYLVSTRISVSENNNNPGQLLLQTEDQAALSANSPIDKAKEIAVLTSIPFIQKTIDAIDFKVSYVREDKIGETELYKNTPFKVTFPNDSLYSKINGKGFGIKFKSRETFFVKDLSKGKGASYDETLYTIGKSIVLNGCPVIVNTTPYFDAKRDIGRAYFFHMNSSSGLAWGFKGGLGIFSDDSKSGIIQIQLKTSTPDKGVDFLNELTKQYIKDKYEEKSRSASQSRGFLKEKNK